MAGFGGNFRNAGEEVDPIVGMWHVTFTAQGNGKEGPPDKTPIDNAIIVWHSDKTEIMNSARPAQDGNFCLGVWESLGGCKYKLSHIAWLSNDTTNAPEGIGKPGPDSFYGRGGVESRRQELLGNIHAGWLGYFL